MSENYPEMTLSIADDKVKLVVRDVPAHLELEKLGHVELLTARVFNSLASRETFEWWRDAIECIGSTLYTMLLAKEELIGGFQVGFKLAGEDSVCRIGLEFGNNADQRANALTFLPWEFLHAPPGLEEDANVGIFLGTDHRFALYRKITTRSRDPKPYHYAKTRLLIVLSDPAVAEEEQISIKPLLDALDELGARRFYSVEEIPEPKAKVQGFEYYVETNPDRDRLQQVVAARAWDVIHFVGHAGFFRRSGERGGGGKVVVVEDGERQLCDAEDFAAWLSRPVGEKGQRSNESTDLVILQTCEGGVGDHDLWSGFRGVASRVAAEGFPAVVAMQYGIRNDVANAFSVSLYRSLSDGKPLDVAVQAGRYKLATGRRRSAYANRDFASPVLFSSGQPVVFFPEVRQGEPEPVAHVGKPRLGGREATVHGPTPERESVAVQRGGSRGGGSLERGRSAGEQPHHGGGRFGVEVDAKRGKGEG